MLQDQENLLDQKVPLIFADGTEFYKKLAEEYITHDKGFFILAPSGAGKSHYYRNQKDREKHWVDADRLWRWAKAMPSGAWWEKPEMIEDVEQKCDMITQEAKKLGFWMLGSANNWLKPDAIVIPNWRTHVKFIKIREKNYDGGAKSDPNALEQVKRHRKWIMSWTKKGVPKFGSIEEAIRHLTGNN
jgi:hypothetical protein